MARRRGTRTPPTPVQRRRMMLIGGALIFIACFIVMYEVVVNERQSVLFSAIAALVLFLVFGVPIIASLRYARRKSHQPSTLGH